MKFSMLHRNWSFSSNFAKLSVSKSKHSQHFVPLLFFQRLETDYILHPSSQTRTTQNDWLAMSIYELFSGYSKKAFRHDCKEYDRVSYLEAKLYAYVVDG